ncbi:metallophosphoesterase [Pseudothermotoga sp.]|uniref:metallophosphoesterase n=1 Tax=Pseudothermotoga sp. TaxID=2033661 RepID=UPI0031F64FB9
MKRIFISDLHIGDGSAKDDFEFDEELIDLLNNFSVQTDVELVIVGDGLELLESRVIKDFGLAPFQVLVTSLDGKALSEIEKRHPKLFESFRQFSKRHRIVYVVGNHDYYLLANEQLKNETQSIMGCEVVPYYYDENAGILAMHGNQFDLINKFSKDSNGNLIPPLGEYMARYMMFYFDEYLESFVPKEILADYDNVRPSLDVFHWFERVLEVYDLSVDILELWIAAFLKMMRTAEARTWLKKNFPYLRCFSKLFLNKWGGITIGSLLVRGVMKVRNLRRSDYLLKRARKLFKERTLSSDDLTGYLNEKVYLPKLNVVVFGHIHHHSFRIIHVKGQNKFYINCGTWRPVVEKVNGKKKYGFQKKAELFYAVVTDSKDGDLEITTNVKNKTSKSKFL